MTMAVVLNPDAGRLIGRPVDAVIGEVIAALSAATAESPAEAAE